jgi:hypothetical protein
MTMTVSPPVRIAALVGLAAALALGGMFMLLGRKGESTASAPLVIKHHPFGPGVKKVAGTKPAASTATPATKAPAVHATRTPTVARKAPAKPAAELAALAAGLPVRLAQALGRHEVVVVELTNPTAELDGIAFAEARAGAALAGVGFVPLNVLSQSDVGKLTEQLGQVLPDPGLLVFTRPGKLVVRIDGFVDKETVAQAAQNAATGT